MVALHRKRSAADDNAALSHERGFGNDDVGVVCRRLNGGQSQILSFKILEYRFGLQNYFIRISRDDVIDALEYLSRWSARRIAD